MIISLAGSTSLMRKDWGGTSSTRSALNPLSGPFLPSLPATCANDLPSSYNDDKVFSRIPLIDKERLRWYQQSRVCPQPPSPIQPLPFPPHPRMPITYLPLTIMINSSAGSPSLTRERLRWYQQHRICPQPLSGLEAFFLPFATHVCQ